MRIHGAAIVGVLSAIAGSIWGCFATSAQTPSTVELVQAFLAEKGCEPGTVDGQWGGGSQKAAKRYRIVSGVAIDRDTDLSSLPPELIEADCQTDISGAPADERPPYVSPTDLVALPRGLTQHNWIPPELRAFAWEKVDVPFIDVAARFDMFSSDQKSLLGCEPSEISQGASRASEMRYIPRTHESMSNGDFLRGASGLMVAAFCQSSLRPMSDLVKLFADWADASAFVDLGLEAAAKEQHESLVRKPAQKLGTSQIIGDTLVFRETLAGWLVAWSAAKASLEIDPNDVLKIETWLQKLVEDQAFAYSETPVDCPSFGKLRSPIPDMLNRGRVLRWDQFEECINTGTSRAGVSALWALISGDRNYAEDALNTYVMTLHLLRTDGSHILESPREEIAHYKSVYNVAWMIVVAEAFAKQGIDLYSVSVEGRSIFSAIEFLAKAAVDTDAMQHYARSREPQQPVEFKDPWHWLILARYPDSKAAHLIKREIAASERREHLQLKLFNVFDLRPETQMSRDALLPFTMFYAPANFLDYAPPDVREGMAGRP